MPQLHRAPDEEADQAQPDVLPPMPVLVPVNPILAPPGKLFKISSIPSSRLTYAKDWQLESKVY